ncbi:cobalt ABC transporter permease [Phaeovulum vinaykumarii]|uniref:Nickel transport protein n=1 Tax=Phaeovulum vinaykumarii TaxID=407234 RepID=A0A1N7MIE2_9RHOB|nr:cobalt ABC transporter permease [Phaeovulum vinaykumarii]SIS85895.1 nickel transport protein [Phaeovulum vinaykumarii]SOC12415.1 nickel transport protein [Phaeovulum vinaykumarii]
MKRILLSTLVAGALCAPLPALAHKVIASVYPSGAMIEGEVGFSDGTMGVNVPVLVSGPDGKVLATLTSDDEGFFTYTPTQAVALTFRADLGAGHVATASMAQDEVARIVGKGAAPTAAPAAAAPDTATSAAPDTAAAAGATSPSAQGATPPSAQGATLNAAERDAVAEMLRDELRPLRKEIAAYREKNDLQAILGGIGYIIGLFGVGFYVAARRRLAQAAS